MAKKIIILIIFCIPILEAYTQVSFQTGSYILYLNNKISPKVTLTLNSNLNKRIELTNYFYASETWGEGLIGFNFKIAPWIRLGALGGMHNDKESKWRYAGLAAFGNSKINLNGMYESGGSDIRERFRGQLLFKLGNLQLGPYAIYSLKIWAYGSRFQYNFKKIPFFIWAIPLYSHEIKDYGAMAGLYYKFSLSPAATKTETPLNQQPDLTKAPFVKKTDTVPSQPVNAQSTPVNTDKTSENPNNDIYINKQALTKQEQEDINIILEEFEKQKKQPNQGYTLRLKDNSDNVDSTQNSNKGSSGQPVNMASESSANIPQFEEIFTIQIGAYKQVTNKFGQNNQIFYVKGSDKLYRYYYGKYTTRAEADKAIKDLPNLNLTGFVSKIKLSETNNELKKEITTSEKQPEINGFKFTLQIAATKTLSTKYQSIQGVFIHHCSDGLYRYYYKKFINYADVENAKSEMKTKGFEGIIKQAVDIEKIKVKELQ